MGEDKEIPVRESLPPEVLASDYKRAYEFLLDFVNNPNNEHIDNYKSLSTFTSAVGVELSILLSGEGAIITEKQVNTSIEAKGQERWKNYRWGIEGEHDHAKFRATYEPENNLVHVIYADKGTPDSIKEGYELFIPTNTKEYDIYVNKNLPNVTIWGERGSWLTYNPASDDDKHDPFRISMYSACLFQSVSAILKALPEPVSD